MVFQTVCMYYNFMMKDREQKDAFRNLSSCRLFSQLEEGSLEQLLKDSKARLENYSSGKLVRQQGDSYTRLILLASGVLEASLVSGSGKKIVVENFTAPAMVASAILISSRPVLPVNLTAKEDTVLVTVAYSDVLRVFFREPVVFRAFLEDAGDKILFLAEKIRLLYFDSLRRKIAGHLLTVSAEEGTDCFSWRYSREQMADLLGAARPSLSRELSRMAEDGLLEMPSRSEVRVNREALQAVLSED